MRRREFIAGLGGVAAWPVGAQAQTTRKLPTIGLLGTGSPSTQGQWWVAFVRRLHELDWIEGRTIATIKGKAEALYVCLDPLFISNRSRISTLAVASRLPTMHDIREFVQVGGLMSYGPDFPALYRRPGDLVDKILRGTKPADIPIEQPTQFDLSINLTTARALGLTIPETLLATADEVIQ
jgi:ABC transporter substrate binding protein